MGTFEEENPTYILFEGGNKHLCLFSTLVNFGCLQILNILISLPYLDACFSEFCLLQPFLVACLEITSNFVTMINDPYRQVTLFYLKPQFASSLRSQPDFFPGDRFITFFVVEKKNCQQLPKTQCCHKNFGHFQLEMMYNVRFPVLIGSSEIMCTRSRSLVKRGNHHKWI